MPQDNERIIEILLDSENYISEKAKDLIDAGAPPRLMVNFFEFLMRFKELMITLNYQDRVVHQNNSIESYMERILDSIDTVGDNITNAIVEHLSNLEIDQDSD